MLFDSRKAIKELNQFSPVPGKHQRKSIRIRGYDYSRACIYFISMCISGRQCSLGRIENGRMKLSSVGELARTYWQEIPDHSHHAELNRYVIMPNHIHGILILNHHKHAGVQNFEPLPIPKNHQFHRYQHVIPQSIGSIIRSFKSAVTHWCRQNGFLNFRWQRNYYEHFIRGEKELAQIRK